MTRTVQPELFAMSIIRRPLKLGGGRGRVRQHIHPDAPHSPNPCRKSWVLNPTSCRHEGDFMRAIHNARAGEAALARAKRGAGSGIASLSAGSSEVARNQIRVRRGIVVSCLQQPALFALDYNCVPRIDQDRRNDRPPVVCGIEVAQGVTGMWWLYFRRGGELAGVVTIEAPALYHARTRVAVRGIGSQQGLTRPIY
jgi:hypothetical protein